MSLFIGNIMNSYSNYDFSPLFKKCGYNDGHFDISDVGEPTDQIFKELWNVGV